MGFSYVATPVAFMNYVSLAKPTSKRWGQSTGFAVIGSLICYLSLAIIGYVSFGDQVRDNIFMSFPYSDPYVNFARLCMIITMILTFPMMFYPARSTLNVVFRFETESKQPTRNEHLFTTISLFMLCVISSVLITNLGKTYELIGAFCSSGLAYLMPAAIYISLFWTQENVKLVNNSNEVTPLLTSIQPPTLQRTWSYDISVVILIVFGTLALVIGTGTTLMDILFET
ncbi:hypothetical protein K7432_016601 [Basidiobolus ranarum]|uniref:Amino acid transporter transmembrane domain-containing protein n=1 Tax=Basidiobolus ranarum TaxID=34480 RepID=A0ABR2WEH9_9FUNG